MDVPSGENADHVEPASTDVYPITLYPRSGALGSSEFDAASRMRPERSAAIETWTCEPGARDTSICGS
jgi:hypothetical protein